MLQQWHRLLLAACAIGSVLASGCARGGDHGPLRALRAKTPPPPPEGMAVQPAAAPAKPAARPPSGMMPGATPNHPPPAPPSTTRHTSLDVPQAKNLATTPDMILGSRVRASLMSALEARNTQDVEPETVNGVVTLTGTVKTQALRARAEQVARSVHGVRAVKNQLTVQ